MRHSRSKEPRIVDPATHSRELVSRTVAAEFLDRMDRRALNHYIAIGALPTRWQGRRLMIAVADLVRFKARQAAGRTAPVPRATAESAEPTRQYARKA